MRSIASPTRSETYTGFIGEFERGPVGRAMRVSSYAAFVDIFGEHDQLSQFFLNGGRSACVLNGALSALDPAIDLLCIPEPGSVDAILAAQSWCEANRCFYLIDPPEYPATPAEMTAWLASHPNLNSANAAIAWPRVLIADEDQRLRPIASSGTVAGIYAANDAARGVWDAPAGLHAPLACAGLEYTMTDAENALLTNHGINAIRRFPTHGIVLWGARTLGHDTQYVPVKRTELFIADALASGQDAETLLRELWQKGALMGSTEADAFRITPDRIGVALSRPGEFVYCSLPRASTFQTSSTLPSRTP